MNLSENYPFPKSAILHMIDENGDTIMSSIYKKKTSRPSKSHLSFRVGGWLLGGLGVGAIIMYFLDPDAGSNRRESALNLAHQAGEQLSKVKSSVMSAVNA